MANDIIIDRLNFILFHLQHVKTELIKVELNKINEIDCSNESIMNNISINTGSLPSGEEDNKFYSIIEFQSTTHSDEKEFHNIYLKLKGTSVKNGDLVNIRNNEIEHFKNVVAIRSMWPYLRELVNSLTLSMNVPQIEIPTIDIMETYKNDKL